MSLGGQPASNMSGNTAQASTARATSPAVVIPATPPPISGAAMNLLGSVMKLDGKDSYFNWRTAIEFPFIAMGLWDHIIGAPGTECPVTGPAEIAAWKAFDNSARALLFIIMSANEQRRFKGAATAAQLLTDVDAMYAEFDIGHLGKLRRDLANTMHVFDRPIRAHLDDLRHKRDKFTAGGGTMADQEFIVLILQSLPNEYRVIRSILNSQISILTVALTERNLEREEADLKGRQTLEDKPSETMALAANFKRRNFKNTNRSFSSSGGSGGSGGKSKPPKGKCFRCQKPGHYKRDCRVPEDRLPKRDESATLATSEGAVGREIDFAFAAAAALTSNVWIVDSGSSRHLSPDKSHFVELRDTEPVVVTLAGRGNGGNAFKIVAKQVGTINLVIENDKGQPVNVTLTDVLYAPQAAANLLSIRRLAESGGRAEFVGQHCVLKTAGGLVLGSAMVSDGLYRLKASVPMKGEVATLAKTTNSKALDLWHRRLGHLHRAAIERMSSAEMVSGLDLSHTPSDESLCPECAIGKQYKLPFPPVAVRAAKRLELVHADLCGPFSTVSIGGKRYFLLLVDDATRYTWVYFLREKGEASAQIKEWKAAVELETGDKLKVLRTDNGGEFTSKEFEHFLAMAGIKHQTTAPYTPQQNGVVERANRTHVERMRAMLATGRVPKTFWTAAIKTSVYVGNRSATRALKDTTPYESYLNKKPSLGYFRTFGCLAYVYVPSERRGKMDDTGRVCRFIGYSETTKGYEFWSPGENKIIVSRHVLFDENSFHTPAVTTVHNGGDVTIPEVSFDGEPAPLHSQSFAPADVGDVELVVRLEPAVGTQDPPAREVRSEGAELRDENENLLSTHRPQRERKAPAHLNAYVYAVEFALAGRAINPSGEPDTFAEAMDRDDADEWLTAAKEEIATLARNGTWELVELPADREPIGCRWVFRIKKLADGRVDRYKARVVAQGFSQVFGVDYQDTFAPVAKLTSMRAVLAMAAIEDLEVHQMDVAAAYLNGDLEEEIYMRQPEGFEEHGKAHLVCRLRKSIYGLKQAGRAWYTKFSRSLTANLGFTRIDEDHSIFVRETHLGLVTLLVYVDDLLLIAKSRIAVDDLKKQLSAEFQVKDLGVAHSFLGIHITRNRQDGTLTLSQTGFAQAVLKRFKMDESKPVSTPMDRDASTLHQQSEHDQAFPKDIYLRAIGSLMYLALGTRPDLSYAVGFLARFSSEPRESHWAAVKRILRYVRGTTNLGLVYERGGLATLEGFVDADWAGDKSDRKSTSGFGFAFGGALISWLSKKQSSVALSTTEAELIAASLATREAVWLRNFLSTFSRATREPTPLHIDNRGVLSLISNPVFHSRTKHIAIQEFYVREKSADGTVAPLYIASTENLSDIFTKALNRPLFELHRESLGLADISLRGSVVGN
jgi:transposase InsO family protein